MAITEHDLKNAGFIKYKSNEIIKTYSDFFYQKRYRDERGVQYFINVWHYPPIEGQGGEYMFPESFTPEVDFHMFDDDTPWIRIEFLNQSKSVVKLERMVAEMWKDMRAGYYERNP